MANVYEHLLHGRGNVSLLCQTPVSPLIFIATVDLSTEGIMILWLFRLRWACSLKASEKRGLLFRILALGVL